MTKNENLSEQIFDCAKRLVALQSELNSYEVDTDSLIALVEQVAKKGVEVARKEINGFAIGKYGTGDNFKFNFTEEDKNRWQKMAGISDQKKQEELAEVQRLLAKTHAEEISTKFFLDIRHYPEDKVVKVVEEFKKRLNEETTRGFDELMQQAREQESIFDSFLREESQHKIQEKSDE